ncbi:ankyrin repeat-containing domain protein [Camillea tinctor]|nr:ankyrin repeat-containing domain protein [Camillea tinctor]
MAEVLLKYGAKADLKDRHGWTPLHAAAVVEIDPLIRLLLERVDNGIHIVDRVSSGLKDEDNRAWLEEMVAEKSAGSSVVNGLRLVANSGYKERTLVLIDSGEDIDAIDDIGGSTADDFVELLLEKRANIDRPDRSGETALYIAARDGSGSLLELLIRNGANVNRKVHGWSPLPAASKNSHSDGHILVARYMFEDGADMKATDYHGRTALHWAVEHNRLSLVLELVHKGADVNAKDRWGMTPLIWATRYRSTRQVDYAIGILLENGADVNYQTREGYNALHLAAYAGNVEISKRPLNKGAEPQAIATKTGLNSVDIAKIMGHQEAVKLLQKRGAIFSGWSQWKHAQSVVRMGHESDDSNESDESEAIDIREVPCELKLCEFLEKKLLGWDCDNRGREDSSVSLGFK